MIDRTTSAASQVGTKPRVLIAGGLAVCESRPIGRQAIGFLLFVVLCFSAAGIGGAITSSSVGTWYQDALETGLGTAGLGLRSGLDGSLFHDGRLSLAGLAHETIGWPREPLSVGSASSSRSTCAGQPCFFGLRSPGLAFFDVLVLWFSIAVTAILFGRRSRTAALLLVPYLLWTSFATVLISPSGG